MAFRRNCGASSLLPFLYPSLVSSRSAVTSIRQVTTAYRLYSSTINGLPESHLNPSPNDYSSPNFADKAEITLYAGRGGSGCISFQREAFMPDGPPNGGDGGTGGNIYIQAAVGETSLHKLTRRRFVRAGRGKAGQGSGRGGTRGEDVVITVPVGTIVRELEREDPVAEESIKVQAYRSLQRQKRKEENIREEERRQRAKSEASGEELAIDDLVAQDVEEMEAEEHEGVHRKKRSKSNEEVEYSQEDDLDDSQSDDPLLHKWILYPGLSKMDVKIDSFPQLPRRTRPLQQPSGPIHLDLSIPTKQPILLAVGGIGGLGNPHFTSRQHPRPMFATRGDEGVTVRLELELKLLADVGLVGLPNAGKSTLVRAMTNSRARVGNWAFTTLQPNIGTVVLDRYSGRPTAWIRTEGAAAERRTRFTVADIPGLIEGAHLDRGLGIAFLRHVERAAVLAFVVDLGNGDAVEALNSLWKEVGLYAQMRAEEEQDRQGESRVDWDLSSTASDQGSINLSTYTDGPIEAEKPPAMDIAGKPWFVVATKADLPGTQDNYRNLQQYIDAVSEGRVPHPSGVEDAWTKNVTAIPVSAINNQGIDRIIDWTVGLFDAE